MCKEVDKLAKELDIIVDNIILNNKIYSIEEIYSKLENKEINTKTYSPGMKIRDYLTNLISLGILIFEDNTYKVSEEYTVSCESV